MQRRERERERESFQKIMIMCDTEQQHTLYILHYTFSQQIKNINHP